MPMSVLLYISTWIFSVGDIVEGMGRRYCVRVAINLIFVMTALIDITAAELGDSLIIWLCARRARLINGKELKQFNR